MSIALRACALLSLAALGGRAAQESQAPLPTVRITVTLVQVDAVVTDSSGRHVAGLGRDDFEILQDGEPRPITYFSYMPALPPAPAVPDGVPGPITPGQVRRTVALVVDDLALSFDNIVRVRTALREFVEQQMQSGDLVALIRTGGGVAILEQFTTDKRILLEAIELLKWRFSGRSGLGTIAPDGSTPAAADFHGHAAPEMLDYGYTMSALGALGTIEQVIGGMRQYPGRKSVVFLSDGFRMNSTVNTALDHLTDLANRSAVSIYTIDPNGLSTKMRGADIDIAAPAPDPDAPRPPLFPGEDEPFPLGGLNDLASRTGGLYFANRNDIPDCIRQAADDQLGYYLLGYSPGDGTFGKNSSKAKFHRVTVRLKRRGLQVRWKSGFEGVPDQPLSTELVPTGQSRERQLLEALGSPFTATGLKVRLTSLFYETDKLGPFVHSMLHFEAKDLTFMHDSSGDWHASVDVVMLAYRGLKQTILQHQGVQDIRLSEDQYQKALREGFLILLNDKVKEPGMFLVRAVVRDRASQRVGSASQFLQVPDTRKGRLAVSGVMVKLATSEVLQALGQPVSASGVEAWSEGGPAVRRYRPGQHIIYALMVINPKLQGSPKEPRYTSQVRLFRNGKLFYTGPAKELKEEGMQDPRHFLDEGVLRLNPQLSPGEFLLQVVVTDQLAGKKNAQASQGIDFAVTSEAGVPPATPSQNAARPN